MKLKKTLLILGAFGIAAAGVNPALAIDDVLTDKPLPADERIYPGSMCQPKDGDSEENIGRNMNSSRNDSIGAATADNLMVLVCPIVKHLVLSEKPIKVYARLRSKFVDQMISCNIKSYNWDHSLHESGDYADVVGPNAREGVDLIGPPAFAGGTHEMTCLMPKGTSILNYHVFEY